LVADVRVASKTSCVVSKGFLWYLHA
jgi:hypothetical protein